MIILSNYRNITIPTLNLKDILVFFIYLKTTLGPKARSNPSTMYTMVDPKQLY